VPARRLLSFLTLEWLLIYIYISSISKSCFLNIRDLRRIRNTIDQTIACIIATSLIHYKIDYCNSLILNLINLPATQTNRLQLVLNSAARAVTKTKFHHITPILTPLVLKYQIDLSTILLLFYGTICHLIYVRLFITLPLLLFKTRLCLIFQPLFSLRS